MGSNDLTPNVNGDNVIPVPHADGTLKVISSLWTPFAVNILVTVILALRLLSVSVNSVKCVLNPQRRYREKAPESDVEQNSPTHRLVSRNTLVRLVVIGVVFSLVWVS